MNIIDKYDLKMYDETKESDKMDFKYFMQGITQTERSGVVQSGLIKESTEARKVKDLVMAKLRKH